jgi:hypothetical protein
VLEQLVDQSLLKVSDTGSGARFRMLETVREFSTAHREKAGETDEVTGRFLAWARDFGAAHHESIFREDLVRSVVRIRAEQDNLLQALRHALDTVDGATVAATSAALAGLWTVDSNFARMATLAEEPAWVLSHFRPEPDFVEVTRTAAVLAAMSAYLLGSSRGTRSLVTLRRLPQAPPDTLARAVDVVVRDPSALPELCESDQPLLAGLANSVASYVLENVNDLDGALTAARRALTAFEKGVALALRTVAHSRISELCLRVGRGAEAREHIGVALSVVEEVGAWSTAVRGRWALVVADLQRGAMDDAERELAEVVRRGDEALGMVMFDVAVRAEILLARGDVDAGLRLWRRVVDRVRAEEPVSWTRLAQAVAVVAHVRHGRLDLVEEIADGLPAMVTDSLEPASCTGFPVCGAVLLAMAMVDLDRGGVSGVRLIALAERFHFAREFQPTMSVEHAKRVAEEADGPAYADAVSSYAGLDPAGLRAAVSSLGPS